MNSASLTIRLPKLQREAIRRAAAALKKSESEYIRDLVAKDMSSASLAGRLGSLIGCINATTVSRRRPHPLKERIRSHNWRKR